MNPNDATKALQAKSNETQISVADKIHELLPDLEVIYDNKKLAALMIKSVHTLINYNPDLLSCAPESLFNSVLLGAELGLSFQPQLNEAFIIPRNVKVKIQGREQWVKKASFQLGYQGVVKLVENHEDSIQIDRASVYKKDTFSWQKGSDPKITHIPSDEQDRGELTHVYAIAWTKKGIHPHFEVMTVAEVKLFAQKYVGTYPDGKYKSDAWNNSFEAQALKTVLKRLANSLPKSAQLAVALDQDNKVPDFIRKPNMKKDEYAEILDAENQDKFDEIEGECEVKESKPVVEQVSSPEPVKQEAKEPEKVITQNKKTYSAESLQQVVDSCRNLVKTLFESNKITLGNKRSYEAAIDKNLEEQDMDALIKLEIRLTKASPKKADSETKPGPITTPDEEENAPEPTNDPIKNDDTGDLQEMADKCVRVYELGKQSGRRITDETIQKVMADTNRMVSNNDVKNLTTYFDACMKNLKEWGLTLDAPDPEPELPLSHDPEPKTDEVTDTQNTSEPSIEEQRINGLIAETERVLKILEESDKDAVMSDILPVLDSRDVDNIMLSLDDLKSTYLTTEKQRQYADKLMQKAGKTPGDYQIKDADWQSGMVTKKLMSRIIDELKLA